MGVKKVNRMLYIYCISCIILSLIIAWTNINFFEAELKKHDKKVFSKVEELNVNGSEFNDYMNQVEKIILEGDLVILYDYDNGKVIDSIGVVVGQQFEEEVNKSIELDNKMVRLDRDKVELQQNTYIHNLNLKIDDIYYDRLEDDYLLYYIPKRIVTKDYMFTRLLSAFSISCFFLSLTIWIFNKQVKNLKN